MTATKFGIGFLPSFLYQGTAMVSIYRDGTVMLTHGGVDMGQGLNTKMIQVASRALGIPIDKIYTNETGTHTIANPVLIGGSMGTDIYGLAVLDACNILIERLAPIRKEFPEASWEKQISDAYMKRVKLQALGFSRKERAPEKVNDPYDYFTFGVTCTEVEIDVLTGENQVLQADIVMDVGKSLNPAIDIGQIEGGFVQGMGMVTSEYIGVDKDGRLTNCYPGSYKIPNVSSIPRKFNVTLLKNHDYVTTCYSSKGIGEPPFLLALSVISAIKQAVQAARREVGLTGYFRLDCPATVQAIQCACGNQIQTLVV